MVSCQDSQTTMGREAAEWIYMQLFTGQLSGIISGTCDVIREAMGTWRQNEDFAIRAGWYH